jgi:hypothetical protein
MKRKKLLLLSLILLCLSTPAHAQLWSGIIDLSRAIVWSQAGVPGGIPTRTTICATLNPGATPDQINSAIASCPANQVVFLNAGTYNLSSGIVFQNKNNVTLRGAGPDKTFLVFTAGTACGGLGGDLCFINGNANWSGQPGNTANWTAGYAKGATSITLDSVTNLQVGSLLILDQLDDSNTDNGALWICQAVNVCSQQGGVGQGRSGRGQTQEVKVTSISGTGPYTIGITPGLYMPNWRASQSPGAWWSNSLPISGSGAEDLSMDHTASSANGGTFIFNGYGIWLKNIRSLNVHQKHVWMYQSVHTTVRDSYFYGTQAAASDSYATDTLTGGDQLIENNIFQHVASPMLNEGGQGTVQAYNFAVDDYFTKNGAVQWQQASSYQHAIGNDYLLWEGNTGIGMTADDIHGVADFITAFRNYWNGRDMAGGSSGGKTQQTNAIIVNAFNRYFNIIGNVLGTAGYHNNYTAAAPNTTNCSTSIYALGWGGNCASATIPDDALVPTTMMRWGNYDTVSNANRFVASEVPSTINPYPNPVPANNNLPNSFYLSAKPSWWGTMPWPAIGPDVIGGIIAGVGGHAYQIPAQVCYLNVMHGLTDGSSGPLTFNANNCYGNTPPPLPPKNLRLP